MNTVHWKWKQISLMLWRRKPKRLILFPWESWIALVVIYMKKLDYFWPSKPLLSKWMLIFIQRYFRTSILKLSAVFLKKSFEIHSTFKSKWTQKYATKIAFTKLTMLIIDKNSVHFNYLSLCGVYCKPSYWCCQVFWFATDIWTALGI